MVIDVELWGKLIVNVDRIPAHSQQNDRAGRGEPGRYVNLGEGDIDWPGVMAALVKVGYNGFVSPEIGGDPNDPDQINKVSRALDKILSLA